MDHDEIFYQQLVLFLSLGFNVGPNTASAKSIRGLADSLVLGATEPADACVIDCGTGPWRTLCTYLQTSLSAGMDFDTAMEDYSFTPMELDAMDMDGSNSTALEMGPPPGGPSGPDPAAPAKTEPDRKTPTGASADSPDDKPGSPSDSSPDSPDDPPTGPSDSSPDSPDDPPTGPSDSSPDSPDDPPTGPTGESKDSPDSPDEPPTGPTGPSDTGPSITGPSDTGPSDDGPGSPSKYVV